MSYCRWSSRCEDGKLSDVYAYLHCAGGVSVHLAGYRQRWWYDLLGRAENWAMDLGGDSWYEDPSKPPHKFPSGETFPALSQRGSWYREPIRRVVSWIRMPYLGTKPIGNGRARAIRWSFWWPHWMTHYVLPLPREEDRYGLSFAEAALFLETLRCKGWNVPEYAIKALDQEDREDPDGWMKQESEE